MRAVFDRVRNMCRSRLVALIVFLVGMLLPAVAGSGRVLKVLPQYLDQEGRHTIYPSLYERDAYQEYLREHPELRSGLRFAVQWRARGVEVARLRLKMELRTITGNKAQTKTIEEGSLKKGFLENWTGLSLAETDYRNLGELNAWRITLWEGDTLLDEYKSFLW